MPGRARAYRLDVRDEVLDDLRERLSRTRWPDEIPGSGWQYGSSLDFMRRLIERWRDGFDWRAQQAKLNAFDQFQVPIGGVNLHFIQQRGAGPDPLPLLLVLFRSREFAELGRWKQGRDWRQWRVPGTAGSAAARPIRLPAC